MKMELMNNATRAFHKVGFAIKKHSPEILMVAGVVGGVASAVLACKATLKVNEVVEPMKENVEKIHVAVEKGKTEAGEEYTVEDSKQDLTKVYAQTGIQLVKLYGPAVLLGAVSVTSILASNNIMRKRNVALAAAYTAVDTGFKNYRNRVIDRFGKELDRELRFDIKPQEVTETVVDENGEEKTVTKTVNTIGNINYSPYAFAFDVGCTGWEKDPEHNKFYAIQCQNYANELLRSKGHLFLNEVYDMFGIPRTKAGQIVGWLYDTTKSGGDGFVDFGIFDINNEKAMDFINGFERTIIIDPNVDGNIFDLM